MSAGSRDGDEAQRAGGHFRLVRTSLLAVPIGFIAAGTAYVVYHLIGFLYNAFFYHRLSTFFVEPPDSGLPWWIIFVPALGGLACGVMAKYGSRRIIGHGIPEAMEAVWVNLSRVKPRIFFLKPLSAAIAIGTGAPFGVEGPIIQGGGAMGSVVGQWVTTTGEERKVMLACGAAAGMAATFNTPLAAIFMAIELLVFEFRARSFIPIAIASLFGTWMRRVIIGRGPMFEMAGALPVDSFGNIPFLVLLGLLLGGAAILFKDGYFSLERMIHRVPVDDVLLPALGGLVFGVIGLIVPRAFGVGYDVIREILRDQLTVGLVLAVMIAKMLGVTVTLGSKTSGGFLAPMFVSGAAIGSIVAQTTNAMLPGVHLSVPLFALAGTGVLFGVLCNATLAFTVFALEVTGRFDAIVPVFLVAVTADIVARLYMRSDLMTTELADRGIDVHQEFEVDLLRRFKVGEVMGTALHPISPATSVQDLIGRVAGAGEEARGRNGASDAWPIVDAEGTLRGLITYGDVVRSVAHGRQGMSVLDAGAARLHVAHEDEPLWDAMTRMARHEVEQLPVVSRTEPIRLIGWLDAQEAIRSALVRVDLEQRQETGWFGRLVRRRRQAPA